MQESLRPVDARTTRNRSDWQIAVKRRRGEPHTNGVPRIPVRCLSKGRSPNSCRLNSVPGVGRRVLNSGADDTGAAWSQYSIGIAFEGLRNVRPVLVSAVCNLQSTGYPWRLRRFCQTPIARRVTSRSGRHRDKHHRDRMPVSISVTFGQLPSEERQGSLGALHCGRRHDFLEQFPLFARQAQHQHCLRHGFRLPFLAPSAPSLCEYCQQVQTS